MHLVALVIGTAWGADQALDGSAFPWGPLSTATRPCNPQPIPEGLPDIPLASAACMVRPEQPIAIGPLACEAMSFTWVEYDLISVGCHTSQAEDDVRKALRAALGRGKGRWRLDDGKEVRLMDAIDHTVVLWWKPPPPPPEEPIEPGWP